METLILREEIGQAAALLRSGGLVAVPTETVYGLAGKGTDAEIIERIYNVKGRPARKPISLMVSGAEMMEPLCREIPEAAGILAERFWPGPLTLVLKAQDCVPEILRAGGETVGLRCPRQPQTLGLLQMLDFPLAVPSANPSGKPSPKTAEEVLQYFSGEIEAVIDGGPCSLGTESTLLDLSCQPYRILRQGALPAEEIADALVDGMQLIGITGGSGGGKTSALKQLEARGARVLDADAVYHEMLENDEALLSDLQEAFPEAFVNGKLSRRRLAAQVFSDSAALQALNGITHRHISARLQELLREAAMSGCRVAAIDAIGLFGAWSEKLHFAFTLAVTASEETRIARIVARDGITREAALQRIRAQKPAEWFAEKCDFTVFNDGSLEEFEEKIRQIMEENIRWEAPTKR